MEDLIGKVLGNRYEIVEKIGAGGMAVVYKARCRLLNRYVAVKVLRTDTEMTDDFIKRFKIEAQSAGSLSHPNIVSIYDVGNEGNVNYIVMEFVEGYTLKEVVENISINDILLETDSPYLTPEPYRGKKNEPYNVIYIAEKIAELKNITVEEVLEVTSKNACKQFNLLI